MKNSFIFSAIILPLVLAIGLPTLIWYVHYKRNTPMLALLPLFEAFSFFFVILAALIPIVIASYSFVGEKVEKTLEPLLATPTTDGEILFGKSLDAFLPCICLIYISSAIFMVLMNQVSAPNLGYFYFPNTNIAVILLLLTPLSCIMAIELSIIISARVNDIRTAQQLSVIAVIPFFVIFLMMELRIITIEDNTFFIIAGILGLVDVILYFTSRVVFQREEILTKWK